MKKLLIVEDDRPLREGLLRSLSTEDLTSDCAATLAEARSKLAETDYDLLLLDCNLPDGNGIDFCAELHRSRQVPVVFLTVLDSELDEVSAFKAGAVDYIKKPFSLMVLRERIHSALSRASGASVYADAHCMFDFGALVFTVDGTEIPLGLTEQRLLRALTANKRHILTRAALIEQLWSCDGDYIDENALSVAVKRLRAKLGGNYIKTVYGLGYKWTGGENP